MVRGEFNKQLLKSVSPVWMIVEEIRRYLVNRDKKIVSEGDIADEIGIHRHNMANFKTRNSTTFIMYVTIWCVHKNLDIRDFIKTYKEY